MMVIIYFIKQYLVFLSYHSKKRTKNNNKYIMYNYSVIIPHYTKDGDTNLLSRAVSSIPQRDDIQVLIVDNSPIQINGSIFPNIKNVEILYSDNTKGAGCARNVGIKNAKGKWLLFLDADDFFTKKAFEIFDDYLESNFDIIFFRMTSCYSDTLEPASRHGIYAKMVEDFILNKNDYELRYQFPSPCSKMIKTELVKANKIAYDEVYASNDVIFGLKIGIVAQTISADNRIVYCATVVKGSLTNEISLKNIESRFYVNIRKNKILKQNGLKKTESVMYFIISSLRFGVRPFFKLLMKALLAGDLFVGWNRWMKTFLHNFHGDKRNKLYIVKNSH